MSPVPSSPLTSIDPWRKRVLPGVAALILSAALHGILPFSPHIDWNTAKSREPIEMALTTTPMLLPEAEELIEAPPVEDEPTPAEKPSAKPAAEAAPTMPEPPPDEPDEPEAVEPAPEAPPEPAAVPTVDDSAVKLDEQAKRDRLAERLALLEKRRAQLREEAERRRAEREKGKSGGAPPAPAEQGTPNDVYLCDADALGARITVTRERPLNQWVNIVPTVLFGFDTKPNLGDYFGRMTQIPSRVGKKKQRLGPVELALPNAVLTMPLEQPRGGRIALGRPEGRCLIGMRYQPQLFPFTLMRIPARILDGNGKTIVALVDITLNRDASFEIRAVDGASLTFSKGRFKNAKNIARNIEDHYAAARFLSAVGELFGIKPKPPPRAAAKR